MSYTRKYQPKQISEIAGQPRAVRFIQATVDAAADTGEPVALVLSGSSGVGKTTAAWAIARALGCDIENDVLGGVLEIASGEQDGKAVKDMAATLRLRPFTGSGWRVAIVNEADAMTKQAELVWLDVLENLPPKVAVVFTTNSVEHLSGRFLSRCHVVKFEGKGEESEKAVAALVRKVLKAEKVKAPADLSTFGREGGRINFRLAMQQAFRFAATGEVPEPPTIAARVYEDGELSAAQKAWETRRAREAAAG
jgi:DNA polymerase III delta prime subunit